MNRSTSQTNRNSGKEPGLQKSLLKSTIHKALLGAILATAVFLTGEGYQEDPLDYLLRLTSLGANVSSIYVQLVSHKEEED